MADRENLPPNTQPAHIISAPPKNPQDINKYYEEWEEWAEGGQDVNDHRDDLGYEVYDIFKG